jgi:CO/xanthine dehydrogenase Mo-binding subunit
LIPTVLAMPPIDLAFIEATFEEGPVGAKNLAEPVMIASAPPLAKARVHASGFRRRPRPLSQESRVLEGSRCFDPVHASAESGRRDVDHA